VALLLLLLNERDVTAWHLMLAYDVGFIVKSL
jgi:hypothetical protein